MTERNKSGFTIDTQVFHVLAWIFFVGLILNGGKGMSASLGGIDFQAVSSIEFFNAVWRALLKNAPTFLLAWAVYDLALFFGRCVEGEVFTRRNVKTLKFSSESLFWSALISALIAPTIIAWIDGDPRGFIWHTSDLALGVAAIGVALYGFADVLARAVEIKEDNDEMI